MPANEDFLFTDGVGISHYLTEQAGELAIQSYQDVDHILDLNQAMYTENDGYTASRDMRRVGSIPMSLLYLWKTVEGWDPFNPANQDRLAKKLNSSEFLKLRTAPGRL
jgi:hypothetical protein